MWNDWYQYGHMGYVGGWHWGFHVVFWILVLAFIVVALVVLVRYLRQGTPGAGGRGIEAALAMLADRYARGEIDREEYLQKKKDLTP
jgi:putative membrane protein